MKIHDIYIFWRLKLFLLSFLYFIGNGSKRTQIIKQHLYFLRTIIFLRAGLSPIDGDPVLWLSANSFDVVLIPEN